MTKFFSKFDWAAFWVATIASFAVYFFTLGPSVGLEDSGELATAAAHLGVPHPPGYPFWTLCCWIFCKLFFWVTYMGYPTPAWCVSLASAVFGALAAGCTAMLICRSSQDFLTPPSEQENKFIPYISFCGGVAGAITFALSPVEWSQSTIVEIYSLNALFLMAVFLFSYRWMKSASDKTLWLTAFIFGLGLTNYQVLVFAIVPLALIILITNRALFRDVFIFLIPVLLTAQLLQVGSLQQANMYMHSDVIAKHSPILSTATAPSTFLLILAILAIVSSFVLAGIMRARKDIVRARNVALYGGGFGALAIFLAATVFTSRVEYVGVSTAIAPLIEPTRYALIAAFVAFSLVASVFVALSDENKKLSDAGNLKFVLLSIAFAIAAVIAALTVPQADLKGYSGEAYPWAKSIVIFSVLIIALFATTFFTKRGLLFAIPVAGLHIAAFILLKRGALNGLTHPQSWWFAWPIAWNFVLLALTFLTLPNGRSVAGAAFFAQLGASFYVYMPIVSDLRNPPMNWGYPRTWDGFKHAIQRGQYEAIGVPSFASFGDFFKFISKQCAFYFKDVKVQFTDLFIPFIIFPFVLASRLVSRANRKSFWQWMGAVAACFLMMSFLLILLADVKGDLQDGFIQKVKFISSHAMLALWIGYGLIFAIALVAKKWKKLSLALSALAVLIAFIYPIVQNYYDDQMVFELGASEQNAHTFGWQFGAYQLNGSKAINDQLLADEEPLPDPNYPPAMDEFSILFGGTDPGRFVPTYMIYAANYRPDIYLITQNALADDTYMSVQRDLYGDEIWIPSKEDSGKAFEIYVDEVQRGVRKANGDLRIENGRVQVTGALGVMEINGILTKMMFDHDRFFHSFYIEESYVIPWMYQYLSPHGLIMKINSERVKYDEKLAIKDRDFWDWYMRRLLTDPMYRRDFAAQKSFSKLRSAIAGLYLHQNKRDNAAQAFRDAVILYPASPESTFRYLQDSLIPERRWKQAMEILDYTDSVDPNNSRTAHFRNTLPLLARAIDRSEELLQKQNLSKNEAIELAQHLYSLGRFDDAANVVKIYVDSATEQNELKFLASIMFDAKKNIEAEKVLNKLLRSSSNKEPDLWLCLARVQFRQGKKSVALSSFKMALRLAYDQVVALLQNDRELQEIASPILEQRR